MNILITGITGFVGSHMADYLLENVAGSVIYASRRWRSRDENISHLYGNDRVKFIEADLLDYNSLSGLVDTSRPDYVFHFAAQSFPGSSFVTPIKTLSTNILGTVNLMEMLRRGRDWGYCDPVIVSVSSSEVYGMPLPEEVPIRETNPIRAGNPYSISKVGHDLMSQYYYQAYGLKIIVTRMFSHEGSRRGKMFALSSFAYQIVLNERGRYKHIHYIPCSDTIDVDGVLASGRCPIQVGNLDSVRTYAHVSDAVRAYWLAVSCGKVGEVYNIGGRCTCTVREVLEMLLQKSTLPRKKFEVLVNPNLVRPTDITLQVPSSEKFTRDTGWEPRKDLDYITTDLLQYWRTVL